MIDISVGFYIVREGIYIGRLVIMIRLFMEYIEHIE
jgi:hypothetical protein